ncbi:uncharacterized protein LOC111028177 [Myzus persicae]|uniref:uncharacterized protein LOC111028177 n=1 Tax=Myzus persicae TaxID=13164 RepID=UPI000B936959|nr:uncharacterized protein LOC111028177 [Myzus persicae]
MRLMSPLSPPQYSSMSPMYDDNDFDPSQAQEAEEDRAFRECLKGINPTQANPTTKPKSQNVEMDPPMLPPSIFGIHEDPITYGTLRVRPSYPIDNIEDLNWVEQSCDVNDGPDFFMAPSQFITPPT